MMSSSIAQTYDRNTFHSLKLPFEIRTMIYEMILTSPHRFTAKPMLPASRSYGRRHVPFTLWDPNSPKADVALFLVNHQISDEAQAVFFTTNSVALDFHSYHTRFGGKHRVSWNQLSPQITRFNTLHLGDGFWRESVTINKLVKQLLRALIARLHGPDSGPGSCSRLLSICLNLAIMREIELERVDGDIGHVSYSWAWSRDHAQEYVCDLLLAIEDVAIIKDDDTIVDAKAVDLPHNETRTIALRFVREGIDHPSQNCAMDWPASCADVRLLRTFVAERPEKVEVDRQT